MAHRELPRHFGLQERRLCSKLQILFLVRLLQLQATIGNQAPAAATSTPLDHHDRVAVGLKCRRWRALVEAAVSEVARAGGQRGGAGDP